MNLAAILRAEGVTVDETPGWQNRRRPGEWAPIGILVHHTAGHNSLNLIIRGRSDLPGPLANIYLDKQGVAHLVAAGRANHAGKGSTRVLTDLRRGVAPTADARTRGLKDDIGGNGFLYGIEVENLGDGRDPYPLEQIEALVACCAAICRYYGWTAGRVAHHREFTARKIDMSWRGPLRDYIASRLANTPNPPPARRPRMILIRQAGTQGVYLWTGPGQFVSVEGNDLANLEQRFGLTVDLDPAHFKEWTRT